MKRKYEEILLAGALAILLPALSVQLLIKLKVTPPEIPEQTEDVTAGIQQEQTAEPTDAQKDTQMLTVLMQDGRAAEMELNAYLTGVVLGEMPADFMPEALKAQAVVARTYTLRRCLMKNAKHAQAPICTDSTCCQAFCGAEEYLARGGSRESVEKVSRAVADTDGLVLTYNGELIEATYFSCSGGRTEDAVAVWGTDVSYLQSVDSPGEENAAHFVDSVRYTAEEFCELLGVQLTGRPESWFGTITYTNGGGVDSMQIGGKTYSGVELRKLLSLRSTAFAIRAVGNSVTITTKGFGHRVGMSQYGAEAMAQQGADYAQILSHYYTGTSLDSRLLD